MEHNRRFYDSRLAKSKAWLSLTNIASAQVLVLFFEKRKIEKSGRRGRETYVIANNGELVFTYDEAGEYGISRARFAKALRELQDRGFIDVAEIGCGLYRRATKFALSDRWVRYGKRDFEQRQWPDSPMHNPGFKPKANSSSARVNTKTSAVRATCGS